MSRSLRILTALAGLAMATGFGSVPTPADARAPEPRKPTAGAYVSRQQRRARERAQSFARVSNTDTFRNATRACRRRFALDTKRAEAWLVRVGEARIVQIGHRSSMSVRGRVSFNGRGITTEGA